MNKNSHLVMIYIPTGIQKLSRKDQEIFQYMTKTHRNHIQQHIKNKQKSHLSVTECLFPNKQKQFFNTVYNKSYKRGNKLSKDQLQEIPAKQFVDLCIKLSSMSIQHKEQLNSKQKTKEKNKQRKKNNTLNKMQSRPAKIKSSKSLNKNTSFLFSLSKQGEQQKLKTLQITIYKLIPRLSKLGSISNKQFLQIFSKKLKQVKDNQCIQQQLQLQKQYQISQKHESIARMVIDSFSPYQQLNFKQNTQVLIQIQSFLQSLQVNQLKVDISKKKQHQIFSIDQIKLKTKQHRAQIFRNISVQINLFNQKIKEQYEFLIHQQQITVKDIKSFVRIYKISIEELNVLINRQLAKINQQLFSKNQIQHQSKFVLPAQLQKGQIFHTSNYLNS